MNGRSWKGGLFNPLARIKEGEEMTAVFKFKRFSANEINALISLMTENGYKVIFEKGDRVASKVTITRVGQEYITEGENE